MLLRVADSGDESKQTSIIFVLLSDCVVLFYTTKSECGAQLFRLFYEEIEHIVKNLRKQVEENEEKARR